MAGTNGRTYDDPSPAGSVGLPRRLGAQPEQKQVQTRSLQEDIITGGDGEEVLRWPVADYGGTNVIR